MLGTSAEAQLAISDTTWYADGLMPWSVLRYGHADSVNNYDIVGDPVGVGTEPRGMGSLKALFGGRGN